MIAASAYTGAIVPLTTCNLMLHWFADLMNVTEEVTIHRIIMNKVFTIQSFETKITRLRSDDE